MDIKGKSMYCDTVRKILDDGVMAEIEAPDLREGMIIVTGTVKVQAKKTKSLMPTATSPQRPRNSPH